MAIKGKRQVEAAIGAEGAEAGAGGPADPVPAATVGAAHRRVPGGRVRDDRARVGHEQPPRRRRRGRGRRRRGEAPNGRRRLPAGRAGRVRSGRGGRAGHRPHRSSPTWTRRSTATEKGNPPSDAEATFRAGGERRREGPQGARRVRRRRRRSATRASTRSPSTSFTSSAKTLVRALDGYAQRRRGGRSRRSAVGGDEGAAPRRARRRAARHRPGRSAGRLDRVPAGAPRGWRARAAHRGRHRARAARRRRVGDRRWEAPRRSSSWRTPPRAGARPASASARPPRSCGSSASSTRCGSPGSAAEMEAVCREAGEQGAEIVAVLGGDGTVSCAANGLLGTGAALAVLPAGTGDDFARAIDAGSFPSGRAPAREPEDRGDRRRAGARRRDRPVLREHRRGRLRFRGQRDRERDDAEPRRHRHLRGGAGEDALAVHARPATTSRSTASRSASTRCSSSSAAAISYGGGMKVLPDAVDGRRGARRVHRRGAVQGRVPSGVPEGVHGPAHHASEGAHDARHERRRSRRTGACRSTPTASGWARCRRAST